MIDKIKKLIIKIAFSPLWLLCVVFMLLLYVVGKGMDAAFEGDKWEENKWSDLLGLFEYWRL